MEEKDFEFETEVIDEEEIEETKPQSFKSKFVSGIKKNGKKIAIGAAIAALGIMIGRSLVKNREEDFGEEIDDDEVLLIEDDSNDEPTEE